MAGLSTITVDLAGGAVVFGDRRVVLTAVSDVGAFAAGPKGPALQARFRLDDGAVVRLIGFGERSRLVRDALADDDPPRALMTALRAAAHEGPCGSLADAVLLAMAGGAEEAPEFDRCAVVASRMQAWSWLSVHDAPAILVDRAVADPRVAEPSGGWTRVVFAGSTRRELEALVDEMLTSLLTRGTPVSSESAERPEDNAVRDAAPMRARIDRRREVGRSSRPQSSSHGRATSSADRDESTPAVEIAFDTVMASDAASPGERPVSSIRGRRRMMPPDEQREIEPATASVTAPLLSRRVSPPAMRSSRMPRHPAAVVPANDIAAWNGKHRPVSRPFLGRAGVDASAVHAGAAPPLGLPAAASPLTSGVRAAAPVSGAIPSDPVEARVAHEPAAFDIARTNAIPSRADLLDEVAQALAAECDLRGIDA